jgi:hypothetical protein
LTEQAIPATVLQLYRSIRAKSGDHYQMDTIINYADILKQSVKGATIHQPRLQAIKLYPVCDTETGQFLVLATGFDK